MKEKIANWYKWGYWTKGMVHDAVPKMLTPEDYEKITGEKYE